MNVFRFKPKHTGYVQMGLNPQPTNYRPFSKFFTTTILQEYLQTFTLLLPNHHTTVIEAPRT